MSTTVRTTVDEVVRLHTRAFPGFFMTQLGPRFLREYYRCVVETSGGILLTEGNETESVGFVAGFVCPGAFYRELRRRRIRVAVAALAGVLTRPWCVKNLLADYRRAGASVSPQSDVHTAELASLAVVPTAAGRGTGSRLVKRFIQEARELRAERVVLTTDTHDNDRVNLFYRRLGFACTRSFEARPGRWLNEYTLDIERD
jgi:ribosomal protein S18 acetylase RimI-like enzyme